MIFLLLVIQYVYRRNIHIKTNLTRPENLYKFYKYGTQECLSVTLRVLKVDMATKISGVIRNCFKSSVSNALVICMTSISYVGCLVFYWAASRTDTWTSRTDIIDRHYSIIVPLNQGILLKVSVVLRMGLRRKCIKFGLFLKNFTFPTCILLIYNEYIVNLP